MPSPRIALASPADVAPAARRARYEWLRGPGCAPCSRRMGGAGIRRGLRGGGALPFQPSQVAGLEAWHKSTGPITIETGVREWRDKTANAHDATQTTGTLQPAYAAAVAAFNGSPTVTFDGTDDYMSIPSSVALGGGSPFEMLLVVSSPAVSSSEALVFVQNVLQIVFLAGGTVRALIRNSAHTAWYFVDTVGTYADGASHIVDWGWDGATLWLTVDAETVSVSAADMRSVSGDTFIGATSTPSKWSSASFAEIMRYNRWLSAAERTRLTTYLSRYTP